MKSLIILVAAVVLATQAASAQTLDTITTKNQKLVIKNIVVGKEPLRLQENAAIECWMLQIDYGQMGAYATFWISTATGEVLKMQEYFRGMYRYKIKLFADNSAEAVRIPKK